MPLLLQLLIIFYRMWKFCNSFLINCFRITILVHLLLMILMELFLPRNTLPTNYFFVSLHLIVTLYSGISLFSLTFIVRWDRRAAGRTAGHRSCLQLSAWGPVRAHMLPPRYLICSCTCFVLQWLQLQEHNAFWAWGFVLLCRSHDCEVSTADILEAGWEGE